MKKITKILLVALGFGLVTGAVGLLTSKLAPAQTSMVRKLPLLVATPTHLGVPTSNLITLSCLPTDVPFPHCSSFRQVDTAGVMATTDYAVPSGETLVILDIDWESTFGTPGATVFLNFSCTNRCAFIYGSSAINDINGIAHGQDHLTSGLYVTYIPAVSLGGLTTHLSDVQLHGYLTLNDGSKKQASEDDEN